MLKLWKSLVLPAALIVLLVGCGTNPDATRLYSIEKLFYQAERAGASTAIDPAHVDPDQLTGIARMYLGVAEKYQQSKTEFVGDTTSETVNNALYLAVQSSMRAASLLGNTDHADEAFEIYRRLPDDYPRAKPYHTVARFETAMLYGRLQQWDSAFAVYHDLMYTYHPAPDTVSRYDLDWLQIPLRVAGVYRSIKQNDLARNWMDSAIVFYTDLMNNYPLGTVKSMAGTYLASAYQMKGKPQQAIDTYRMITDSSGRIVPQAWLEIGNVYLNQLNNPDSALAVYKDLVAARPDDPLATTAQTRIAAVLIDQGKYDKARELLRPLKAAYEKKGQIIAAIQLLFGRSYEQEGSWDRALNEYSWLIENFPNLPQTLDVYLHVISQMVDQKNMTVARQWQRKAQRHFEKIIAENPTSELAASAQTALARSHLMLEDWAEAAEAYRVLLQTYPPAPSRVQTYLELSAVYAERLDDPGQGADILEKLLSDFPNLPRAEDVRKRMEHLRSQIS